MLGFLNSNPGPNTMMNLNANLKPNCNHHPISLMEQSKDQNIVGAKVESPKRSEKYLLLTEIKCTLNFGAQTFIQKHSNTVKGKGGFLKTRTILSPFSLFFVLCVEEYNRSSITKTLLLKYRCISIKGIW